MLEIKYIADDIIEVKESIMSFHDTRVSYFYYDITNWICYNYRPVSTPMTAELIRSNPAPDKKYHDEKVMSESDIDWAKKHYLPKASARG